MHSSVLVNSPSPTTNHTKNTVMGAGGPVGVLVPHCPTPYRPPSCAEGGDAGPLHQGKENGAGDGARDESTVAPSTSTSIPARPCCGRSGSRSASRAPSTAAASRSAARARCTSTARRSAPASCRSARPKASRSPPSKAWRARRCPAQGAEGLARPRGAAVRLLPGGHDHGGGGAPEGQAEADRRRHRRDDHQHLPLRHVPAGA